MDNRLRKALESRGLPAGAPERDAQDFFDHLPIDEKGRLDVELAGPEVRTQDPGPVQVRGVSIAEELTTRSISLRVATIDEESRSVEAVIATERPVTVWDWRRGEPIDEVLLVDGARLPEQLPLLANHSRWDLDDVLGSGRKIRAESTQIVARLFFAENDEPADRAWNKARQGHLRDVSIGYRVVESTDIQPNSTTKVNGRTFKSGKRALRVATAWEPVEVSLVPIGADQAAKLRQSQPFQLRGNQEMDPKLREYLLSIGLRTEADETEAKTFRAELTGELLERAKQIEAGERKDPPADPPVTDPPADRARIAAAAPLTLPDPAEIARQAIAEERERVREITELAGADVPQAVRERAITEGWDTARASAEFLVEIRKARQPDAAAVLVGGPAIHSRNHDVDCNVRSLAAGTLIGQGLDPTQQSLHRGHGEPLRGDRLTEQDADRGEPFRGMSAPDLFRECLRLDTGRYHRTLDEAFHAVREAPSGGSLAYVFGTNVYAQLVAGWTTTEDTTGGWCDEEDVPNFLLQEDISIEAQARLEQLSRGGTANDASISDKHETYKIARYAKKFGIDEQDIIDDRLGAIMRMPAEMGMAARRLRPDLVYSLMLENPSLVADSTAVFQLADHANLGTGALGAATLKAAITAMGKQRDSNSNVLNITPKYLIFPADLSWTADELLSPAMIAKIFADSADPQHTTENLIARRRLLPVMDDRLGATGVVDPRTGTARTGSATNWALAAGGSRSIRVAYRRGTGRQPVMRSNVWDKGQWGQGWDINLDIGAAFMDYRGWYWSSGAGS